MRSARQALDLAARDLESPDLDSSLVRGQEDDRGTALDRPQARRLADGHVAVHRRGRHDVVPAAQVRAAAGVGAIGRESPDVGPVVGGEPAEGHDRTVVEPGRRQEDRVRPVGDRRARPVAASTTMTRDLEVRSRSLVPAGGDGDTQAIGRPGEVADAVRAGW